MVSRKLLKQFVSQTYLHKIKIYFYLFDASQLVMHIKLILFSGFCKIFSFKKFDLKCLFQVKIDIKMYSTKNRCCGLKVVFAL